MKLILDALTLELGAGETVLDCAERHGLAIPSSCRSGICQSCLLRAREGNVPNEAQLGLRPGLRRQGYLLACLCRPTTDLVLDRGGEDIGVFASKVLATRVLGSNVIGVWLSRPDGFAFEAGQFVQLTRPGDGLTRPYSLACASTARTLELHVALLEHGRMSQWLRGATGEAVSIRGPLGECTYSSGDPGEPLLLVGTGTGLAPLLGVLSTALEQGHAGPIRLIHGARRVSELYAKTRLLELAVTQRNLDVCFSVLEGPVDASAAITNERVEALALAELEVPAAWRAYVCGHPRLVQRLRKELFVAGMELHRIHSDAFVHAPAPILH